jgi:SAM-dependent methyltransferase
MTDHQYPLTVPPQWQIGEKTADPVCGLTPALAVGIREVEVPTPIAMNLRSGCTVQLPVVAFPEPPVHEDREGRAGKGQFNRLNRSRQIRHEDGGQPIVATALAERRRPCPPSVGKATGKPPGGDALLVVLTDRVGLVDDLYSHHGDIPHEVRVPQDIAGPRCHASAPNGRTELGQDEHVGRLDDIRLSFNEAADIYDRVRPTYPAELFDALFQMLPPQPEIVEVGPGTGQATKDLLARGASVLAIEIGPAMAGKLRSNVPSDRLRVEVGDFELTEIEVGEVDAVFSATAYHWISRQAQVDRPAVVLRPGGLVAIIDLIQVDSPNDRGFFAAAQPIYERYGQGHPGPPAPIRAAVDPAIRAVLDEDPRFDSAAVRRYDWDQTYSASEYRDLMVSYSGTQMMKESDRMSLLDDMESFIRNDFSGVVIRPLVVTLTTATLLRR